MIETLDIKIEDFDYTLPEDRIALHPLENRDKCKLLVREPNGMIVDSRFDNLEKFLPENSLLVVNNTKVINARLRFRKGQEGAGIEIFCLEPVVPADYERNFASKNECVWRCLVGNSKKWKDGRILLTFTSVNGQNKLLEAERLTKEGNTSIVKFSWDGDETFSEVINSAGDIPIPPYLNRESEDSDKSDYQTVYSRIEGSVAAPTAGLHFTEKMFERLSRLGCIKRELTLHVGAGTFQPVKSEKIGDHEMHSELINVSLDLIKELAQTERSVIAVGTTSVRTLESLYHFGRMVMEDKEPTELTQWYAYNRQKLPTRREALTALVNRMEDEGETKFVATTRIMIAPGYEFKVVDGIVTNFHQPKSTLLLLISAFTQGDWRTMYNHAIDNGYRFLSYGDAMLLK